MGTCYRITCLNDGEYVDMGKTTEFELNLADQLRCNSFLFAKVNQPLMVTADNGYSSGEVLNSLPKGQPYMEDYNYAEEVKAFRHDLLTLTSKEELESMASEALEWRRKHKEFMDKQFEEMKKEKEKNEVIVDEAGKEVFG